MIPFLATRLCLLLLSPMTSYKPYFHSFYKRAPITQPLVSKSELASPLPPHREQFTSQVLITRSDTQKLELANLVLHLQLFSSVQFSRSVMSDSSRPHGLARQASLSITNSWSLLKLMSIELVMPSNHLILCRPLLLLPSLFPNIRVFSNESVLRIRQSKYWSFSFSISPSNEYSRLISFRMDWLDLLAVQGTLERVECK